MEQEQNDKPLPDLKEGQVIFVNTASVKEGFTTPPSHFTEDSILHAMETAGSKDTPDDAEHKGLGTPATRAGILEKLVANGFIERKKSKKSVHLIPTRRDLAHHRSSGTAPIPASDRRMGIPPKADRAR